MQVRLNVLGMLIGRNPIRNRYIRLGGSSHGRTQQQNEQKGKLDREERLPLRENHLLSAGRGVFKRPKVRSR